MQNSEEPTALIIVAVDGTRSSVAALQSAKNYAETHNARLRAISVWSNVNTYSPFMLEWSLGEDARFQLEESSREVFGDDLPDWYEQEVAEGSAAKVLIEASKTAELLVVGSRGHGGFAGLFLGSVSAQCAAHAHSPVMIVREHNDLTATSAGAPIVVGHDGSANGDDALEWALNYAEKLGAPVEVVRTWSIDRIPPQFNEEFGYVPSFDEVTARVRRDLITETAHRIGEHTGTTVTLVAAMSQPAEELIKRSEHARLLVVGSRGRGGFAGLMLGSVSSECASHAHCPVAVVPKSAAAHPDL
ncbi:universal stress protein [Subtercola boreus]|nr:universal stress protein [Subtercola boreus]